MKNKKLLRRIAYVMLMIAILFVGYTLYHPEAGSAFYIDSFYAGSAVWRKFYLIYNTDYGCVVFSIILKQKINSKTKLCNKV